MSRYIDAEALLKDLEEELEIDSPMLNEVENKLVDKGIRIAIKDVKHFSTADVVEVVRCKDCKHHPDNGGDCDRSITHTSRDYICEVNTYRYIGLDYCSYGERSANGT